MSDPIFSSPFAEPPKLTPYECRQQEYSRRRQERLQVGQVCLEAGLATMREEIRTLRAEAERRERVIREYDRT